MDVSLLGLNVEAFNHLKHDCPNTASYYHWLESQTCHISLNPKPIQFSLYQTETCYQSILCYLLDNLSADRPMSRGKSNRLTTAINHTLHTLTYHT